MKPSSIVRTLTLFGCVLFFISCTPREDATEKPQSLTFETIEKGTYLEDARKLLAMEYDEHRVGQKPDLVLFLFADGRQLAFTDGQLTKKNTAEEIDEAMKTRKVKSGI